MNTMITLPIWIYIVWTAGLLAATALLLWRKPPKA